PLVRHRIHAVGSERRVSADAGRAGERDADPSDARVSDRHPGGKPRPRLGDRDVPRPAPVPGALPRAAEHQAERVLSVAAARTPAQKSRRRHLLIYAGVFPYIVIAVFPVYWMLITAFKQEPDLYRMDHIPFWFNLPPTLKNFQILFFQTNYGSW